MNATLSVVDASKPSQPTAYERRCARGRQLRHR